MRAGSPTGQWYFSKEKGQVLLGPAQALAWSTSLGQSPSILERSLVTVNQATKGNTTDKKGRLAEVRTVVKKK
jgi:hypothetical protein